MESVKLTPEQERARKRRNLMIALSLAAFMVLVFAISMVQVRGGAVGGGL